VADNISVLTRLSKLSTADLSDAMDRYGIAGQCLGIAPLKHTFRMVGCAWTLRYGPVGNRKGTVGDYIDELGAGDVVVLDNQGRLDATVWGDLLTCTAAKRHVAGTVIDGICRDADRSFELDYPIFSRGNWMRTGKDRVMVEATQIAVSVGGICVQPGDYILGDGDGVVCIPQDRISVVVDVAEAINAAEQQIRSHVSDGAKLRDARREFGYHQLQTRQ
jgi:4-hydroxy-4-methyl-2-oxoglutarate aldolase